MQAASRRRFTMHLRRACLDCDRLTEPGRSRCGPCHTKARSRWDRKSSHRRGVLERDAAAADGGGGSRRLRAAVNAAGGAVCASCGDWYAASDIRIDHRIPLSVGGGDRDEDVDALCLADHNRKSAIEAERRRKPNNGAKAARF